MTNDSEVKEFIEKLERLRIELSSNAKSGEKLKKTKNSESRRDIFGKSEVFREQQKASKSKRNLISHMQKNDRGEFEVSVMPHAGGDGAGGG